MPYVGQFKAIVVLLVALCTFASFFYFRVWSSIDINNDNGTPLPSSSSSDSKGEPVESVIFRQQQHHQPHQSKQNGPKQEPQQPQEGQTEGLDGAGRPILLPETELRPMMKDPSQENNKPPSNSITPSPPQSPKPPRKNKKQRERERLKQEKAERERFKEENRRRKAAKLMRLKQLDNEPYPALISTNNARVAALNLKAFAKFCHSKIAQDRVAAFAAAAGQQESLFSSSTTVGSEMDFASFEDWTDYIHNKNTGQEQEHPPVPTTITATTPAQNPDSPDSVLAPTDQQAQDSPSATAATNPPKRLQQRPLFMERPLRGWIINYTAILEPCDRRTHTSAHCLDYLTKEHLYLIPSREARSWPNRIHRHPSQVAPSEKDDIEAGNESMTTKGSIIDGYGRETGSGSDGRIVTTFSTITTTTITSNSEKGPEDELEEAGMMHFHIFWQGVITDKLSLSAYSFLFSQPLDRARLHLWIDSSNLPGGMAEDYLQNSFAKDLVSEPLNKYIKFHDWRQEAQHAFAYPPSTPPTNNLDFDELSEEEVQLTSTKLGSTPLTPPVALSDEARFLILNRYGGMYLDADVLLLRDMSPFYDAGIEFAYEWSNQLMYNTAILRLNKGSNVARRILDGATMKEKGIQEKKLRKAMEGKSVKVKITKDGATGVDPLRMEKAIQVKHDHKDKKRVRGGKFKAIKQPNPVVSSTPTPAVAEDVAPSASNQEGYDSGEDDALGSWDGDSLFGALIDRTSGPSSRRYHHHHRRRQLAKRGEMRPNEIYHPARLREYLRPQDSAIENNGLVMMPVAAFDPLWLRIDGAESKIGLRTDRETTVEDLRTFPDAFSSAANFVCPQQQLVAPEGEKKKGFTAGPEVFVMGAYAYHWHNNWLTPIEEQSWMGLMREAYEQFLEGGRPNLYGEWFHGDSNAF
ncbi:hypothetical protein BGZ96_010230 [Linnemannia gamsii]|uniref:Glycosyltransferase family 32 protein n=1 Tax=Linnemannia gamsii TaxID=64522 RepID=A0ABQ7KEJ4_9FUNG|nr:hypothetical protein BGZ96_010230 [Linnemannia gamsii]